MRLRGRHQFLIASFVTIGATTASSCKSNNIASNTINNNTLQETIGPSGGEIDGPSGIKVLLPAGAVPTPTQFTLATTTQYPDLKGQTALGPIYAAEPHGFTFAGTVTVELPLNGATAAQVLHSECTSAGACAPWDTSVNQVSFVNGDAVFSTSSFSLYTLVPPTEPEDAAPPGDSGGDSAPPVDAGGGFCTSAAALPSGTVRQVSLVLTGVDFGDSTSTAWQTIGLDLDDKCTGPSSTDVCTLYQNAPAKNQDDGIGGIDNNFGSMICPLLDTSQPYGCSTALNDVYLVTDSTGSGTLTLASATQTVQYPVQDVYVATTGAGGVAAGVMPVQGVISAEHCAACNISTSLCSGSAFAAVQASIEQATDILSDGTNRAGQACNAISFGVHFTGSAPLEGGAPVPGACPDE